MSLVKNKDKDSALKEGPAADYAQEAAEAFKRDQARNKEILSAQESYKLRKQMEMRNKERLRRREQEKAIRREQRKNAMMRSLPKRSPIIFGEAQAENRAAKKA